MTAWVVARRLITLLKRLRKESRHGPLFLAELLDHAAELVVELASRLSDQLGKLAFELREDARAGGSDGNS